MSTVDQATGALGGGANSSRTRPMYLDGQYASMFPYLPEGVTADMDLLDMLSLAMERGGTTGLLRDATVYLDSKDVSSAAQVIPNRGSDGGVATIGSVGGATVLPSGGGLYLPGIASNYGSAPDAAGLDITGDIDIRVWAVPDEITPASENEMLAKSNATGDQRSWRFSIQTSGALRFLWSTAGTSLLSETTTATITDAMIGFRVTRDATSGDVEFYTTTDGTTWDAFESETSTPSAIFSSTADLTVGSYTGGGKFNGTIQKTELYDGIDGTLVASPDFTAQTAGTTSFDDDQGNTWTVNNAGADTNDPTLLPHDGEHYVYLPGASDNYLSTPDAAVLDITGDIDIRVWAVPDDITPAAEHHLLCKWLNGGFRSYRFTITTSGALEFRWSTSGANEFTETTAALITAAHVGFRVTRDATTGDVEFYTTTDGTTWDAFESETSTPSAIFASTTSLLEVGSFQSGTNNFTGTIQKAELYDGIDGTLVASMNPAADIDTTSDVDAGQSSWTSSTGETWTVNRGTSGLTTAVVTRPTILLDGVDDWMGIPHTATYTDTTGAMTVAWCGRLSPNNANWDRIFSTETANNNGFYMAVSAGRRFIVANGDGATIDSSGPTSGTNDDRSLAVFVAQVNEGDLTSFVDGTQYSAAAMARTPTHNGNARLGTQGWATGSTIDGETLALAIWDRALTADEITRVTNRLLSGNYT